MNTFLLIFPAILMPYVVGIPDILKSIDKLIAEKPSLFTKKDDGEDGDVYLHKEIKSIFVNLENLKTVAESTLGLNAQNALGNTPLHESVMIKRLDIVKILLEAGAHTSLHNIALCVCCGSKNTPLHLAAWKNSPKIVQELVNYGANVDALNENYEYEKNTYKYTAIQIAARDGHLEVVRILLEANAKIEAPGSVMSALHMSVRNHHTDITRLLLEKGGNPNARYAESYRSCKSVVEEAVDNVEVDALEMLLNKGGKVDEINPHKYSRSLLHALIFAHSSKWPSKWKKETKNYLPYYTRMLELLLKAGANPCVLDSYRFTPVQLAINYHSFLMDIFFEEITAELASGVEGPWTKTLDIQGYHNKTPLSLAITLLNPDPPAPKPANIAAEEKTRPTIYVPTTMDKEAGFSKAIASIIRFQSHRLGKNFKLTVEEAEKATKAFIDHSTLDAIHNIGKNSGFYKFNQFLGLAIDKWKKFKGIKFSGLRNLSNRIRSMFMTYKAKDCYPLYVVLKEYYPSYYRKFAPRLKEEDDASMLEKGQQEVKDFEDAEINDNKNEFARILRSLKPLIGQRTFLEEEAVLLAIIRYELVCDSNEVSKSIKNMEKKDFDLLYN